MNEDEVLAKITRLLEKGCTMLASHHDCGAPLFRCQGDIVCPVCSFQEEPLSTMRVPATEAGWGKDERTPDPCREQPPQMQKKSPGSAMEEDHPGHSVAEDQSVQSMGRDQSDRSLKLDRTGASMGRDQSDHSLELDRTGASMGRGQSDPSIQDDVLFGSVKDNLRSVLLLRLRELTDSLRAEQDLDKLERLLDCLDALLRVLRSLQE
ncbi:MAG: hypothetical protein LUQ53_00350 [Methanothrix sp.]|jgi:UPF0148 protein|nr:hypothetical protein [Methanothrix sp.]